MIHLFMPLRDGARNQHGQVLISGLITAAILGIITGALCKFLANTGKLERGLDSNSAIEEVVTNISQLIQDADTCAKSFIHFGFAPTCVFCDPNMPQNTPISIYLPYPDGEMNPTILYAEGTSIGNSHRIKKLRLEKMFPLGAVAGEELYFSTLLIEFEAIDSALSFRPLTRRLYFKNHLDAVGKMTKCYKNTPIALTTNQSCPANQVATGITTAGTFICGTDESTPNYVSDWFDIQAGPQTITHNLGSLNYRVEAELLGSASSAPTEPVIINYSTSCPIGEVGPAGCCTSPQINYGKIVVGGIDKLICATGGSFRSTASTTIVVWGAPQTVTMVNFNWTNKTSNTITVGNVGESKSAAGTSPAINNAGAKYARVRLSKY